jgi:hypothetical protein
VLIRNAFPGRLGQISLFRFFPEARAIAETFPTISATVGAFVAAGFAFEELRAVPQTTAPGLRELRARVLDRADTTLAALSEAQFRRGLDALDREISEERIPRPVVDSLDLLVFG